VPCPPAAAPLTANTALGRDGSSSSDDSARKALCFFKLGAAASARARAAAAASCASAIAATNERVGGVVVEDTLLAHYLRVKWERRCRCCWRHSGLPPPPLLDEAASASWPYNFGDVT
jgi:hypothetical protein